ncbi:MAG: hypothetical protein H8D80_01100 [Proteobacteria bacterium]|nr:hypothetical protein [Pseudomonadota bacterium]
MKQENIIKSVMDGDYISARKETKNVLYRKAAEQMDALKVEISKDYAQQKPEEENGNYQEGE